MSKVQKYHNIISKYLNEFADQFQNDEQYLTHVIIDEKNHRYYLVYFGFENNSHIYEPQFHFEIINEKIWIQCNFTDIPLSQELLKLGVPNSDIVFGFLPEYSRYLSGFGIGENDIERAA